MKKIARISKEDYSIANSKKAIPRSFANIDDGLENTVITSDTKVRSCKGIITAEGGYRLITFDMVLPLDFVGFIAKISTALAEEKIPVFVISAYSRDHILVKKKHLLSAKKKLKQLGFEVK
ncbi:MAG: ACT domain-containing protein [Candidatus Altiarchaeota archaeon]